jgi:hypothetical protein
MNEIDFQKFISTQYGDDDDVFIESRLDSIVGRFVTTTTTTHGQGGETLLFNGKRTTTEKGKTRTLHGSSSASSSSASSFFIVVLDSSFGGGLETFGVSSETSLVFLFVETSSRVFHFNKAT